MTTITIIDVSGNRHEIDAEDGTSVMQAAIANGIEGIVAECNGNASCATCHCYLDDETAARTAPPADFEAEMLEFTAAERRPGSRLSCQVVVCPELAGMVVTVPETQI